MKNLASNSTQALSLERTNRSGKGARKLNIPTANDTTTADRLLYLKDCLDKNIIDQTVFRALRDELTYGAGFA